MSICFLNDWKTKDGRLKAIPHYSTTNDSFLRTAHLFRKMNVANWAFPLALYDPDLLHVKVHELEDDTPENEILRTKAMIEARRNVWYWLRECVRIYGQGGSPVPFRLDRGNCAMAWCFLNGIDYVGMAPRQLGKAQPLNSLIKTPEGWSTMADMHVGKIITAPDGTTTQVIGVYPQGVKDIYRVYFEDGRWTDCCEDHLWKVYNRYWSPEDTQWRVVPLKEIKERLIRCPNTEAGLFVPLPKPEIKEDVDLPLDPYLVGALIGDGSLTNYALISSQDEFILNEFRRLLPEHIELIHSAGVDYRIIDRSRTPAGRVSPFLELIRSLGLNKYSYEKSIPDMYMNASTSQKLALIQGLMDTDGTVDGHREKKNGRATFCTTSLKLAKQVQYLIRSLGGICKIKEKQPHYTHKGVYLKGRLAYIISIRINDPKSLFRLPRKLDKLSDNYKSAGKLKLGIKSIEYVGTREAQCIEVDHPDHLYITDDYIVTHNTVGAVALMSWIMYSSGEEFQIGHFCKDNTLREENVKRIRGVGETLPPWWLSEDKFRDKKNTTEIYYHAFKTHFQTGVANADPRKADLQARGSSQPVQWIDEGEFCINIGISYPTMIASTTAARENARLNGKPHSNIITTTAGDPSNPACKEAAKIFDGAMAFSEHLYDLENAEKLHEVVEANSPQKMIIGVFSHLQLGKDNKWLQAIIKRTNATKEQVMRDYLNRRVSIADKPIIPAPTLALINQSQRDPDHIEILNDKFVIYWYLPKHIVKSQEFKQKPIVVGCDSSEMIGRDATTLIGIDPSTLEVVFSFRASEGNINVVGVMIANLLLAYPKMVWVPENKSSGTSLIDIVSMILRREGHNPFVRLYNTVIQRRDEIDMANIDIRDMSLLDTSVKKYFGIKTDKTKRDELYSTTLLDAVQRAPDRIRDQMLIQELNSLTERNGRVDHAVGGHDDTVIAFLMAMFFILSGKNLHMYGIKPGTVLSYVNPGQPDKNRLSEERQQAIRDRIESLQDTLKYQKDDSLRRLIEADIRLYQSMVEHGIPPIPSTADELTRDPQRYTDPITAKASRPPVDSGDLEKSLKMMFRVR